MYYSRLNNGKDVNILWFLKLVLLYAVNKKIIIQESTAFESGINQNMRFFFPITSTKVLIFTAKHGTLNGRVPI